MNSQEKLFDWQQRNFPNTELEKLPKEELIKMIKILQVTLGICEEAGEVAHAVLKGSQNIREGVNGYPKDLIGDGVGDIYVFSNQLLSMLKMDIKEYIDKTIETVLRRNWVDNKLRGNDE